MMGKAPRLELLLLCQYSSNGASTIVDHVDALRRLSAHRIHVLSYVRSLPPMLDLDRFDGIILHYSLVACSEDYIDARSRRAIAEFKGLKLAFVQDEYRFIDSTVEALRTLGVHGLFTCIPDELLEVVYPAAKLPGVVRETVLTGYVPEALTRLRVPPYEERPLEIGYRARKLPAWLGELGAEKHLIAERVLAEAPAWGLKCDISTREEDRLYGDSWTAMLSSCKAVLGTESGASVLDFTGRIQQAVERHVAEHPNATFGELRDRYFAEEDGRHVLHVISPRIFEAAALRTLMILYEGTYSGAIEPWRHYVPLRKDHSNMADVVAIVRDPARATPIISRAYDEVARNPRYSFAAMVRQFDDVIDRTFEPSMRRTAGRYASIVFRAIQVPPRLAPYSRRIGFAISDLVIRAARGVVGVFPRSAQLRVRRHLLSVWHSVLNSRGSADGQP
jgi:hypothetical protein